MTIRLGVQALGVVTPLGCGKNEVARELFAGTRGGLITCSEMIPGKTVYVGAVTGALPEIPPELSAFDCRNNRLMLAALMEIAGDVADAADRFGQEVGRGALPAPDASQHADHSQTLRLHGPRMRRP